MATGWVVGAASYAAVQGIVYGVGAVINYMPIIPAGTTNGLKHVWNGTNDHWISLGNYLNLSTNTISQTASYAGTGGVMWANVHLATYSGSSSYFDRPTVFYASAGGAGGEWGGIFDRLYDYYFTIPQYSDFPTNVPMATGTIPIGGPLRKGQQAIRLGKKIFNPDAFHEVKKGIIVTTKLQKFAHIVGKNPDLMLKEGKIFLTGAKNGPACFIGKTYDTGLTFWDFMKLFY